MRWAAVLVVLAACSSKPPGGTGGTQTGGESGGQASAGASNGGSTTGGICAPACGPAQVCVAGQCMLAGASTSGAASSSGGASSGGAASSSASGGVTGTSANGSSSTGGSTGSGTSSGGTSGGSSLCSGSAVFCDDFTAPSLGADYSFTLGSWARNVGDLTVSDSSNPWERPRATLTSLPFLASGVSNFDVTFVGATQGDPGFGFFWASNATTNDDGYAVVVHPGEFQGIFLKQFVSGQPDVNIASVPLSPGLGGTSLTVRIQRVGSQVTVWLNGTQMLSASDGAGNVSGNLGLLLSTTNNLGPPSGATWTLFRIDQAGPYQPPATSGGSTGGGSSGGGSTSGGSSSGGGATGGWTVCGGGPLAGPPQPVGVNGGWTLMFDDEFNGNSLDLTRWSNQDGHNINNVTTSASNLQVAGGYLILTLASASSGAAVCSDSNFCGAGVNGYELPVGGYAEACINFPGSGSTIYNWPAWWASGPNWPAGGEEDVAEGLGYLTVNYHSPSPSEGSGQIAGTWSNAFHTYGVYRGATSFQAYYDGVQVASLPTSDNGAPQGLIINVGYDANYGPLVVGSGSQVLVDYVRAWQ